MTKRKAISAYRLRRSLRAAVAAVAAVLLSFIPQTSASAQQSVTVLANQGNWFWSSNNKITVCQANPAYPSAGPGGVCGPISATSGGPDGTGSGVVSPISTGHVVVSAKEGSSDMRAYLAFDLSSVPFGAKVTSMVMTLTVSNPNQAHSQDHADRGVKTPATVNQNAAAIRACLAAEPWGPAAGGDGGDPPYATAIPDASTIDPTQPDQNITTVKNEPPTDCGISILGTKSADGSIWRFDLTRMAQAWATGQVFNNGIALLPEMRGLEPTWQVEFHGPFTKRRDAENNVKIYVDEKQAASAVVEYEAPETPPPPPPTYTPPAAPPVAGGGIPVPSFGNPNPGESAPPVPPAAQPPSVSVASTGKTPWYAWAILPLGVLGMGLVSTAVGADGTMTATASNRVAGVLRARRLAGGESVESMTDSGASDG